MAAHEFTHYVDLVRRLSTTNVISDEVATTLFEASYADSRKDGPRQAPVHREGRW